MNNWMNDSFINKSVLSVCHVFGILLATTRATKEIKGMPEVFEELLVKLKKQDLGKLVRGQSDTELSGWRTRAMWTSVQILAVCPWASHITSLVFSFHTCKMELIITHWVGVLVGSHANNYTIPLIWTVLYRNSQCRFTSFISRDQLCEIKRQGW